MWGRPEVASVQTGEAAMRYLLGLVWVAVLGMAPLMGCTESKQADLEWPPDATAYFDEYGILSADCATDEDCAMVLGYYHAADRFVQMDFFRRLATGRLAGFLDKNIAQALGVGELSASFRALFSTRQGLPLEQVLVEQASPKTSALLEAYSAGVNQWIADLRNGQNDALFPREFTDQLFVYGPDSIPEWTPQDSLSTVLVLVELLTNKEDLQIAAAVARDAIDNDAKFSDLWSMRPIFDSAILPPDWAPQAPGDSSVTKGVSSIDEDGSAPSKPLNSAPALQSLHAKLKRTEALRHLMPRSSWKKAVGSNNWAIAPSLTAAGHTLIANDQHLSMSQPTTYYLAHLDAKTMGRGQVHAAGFTLAGLPWFIAGQNEDIVWTVTDGFMDLTDVYVEELTKDAQGNPTGVMFQGEPVPFTRVPFTVTFVNGDTQEHELRFVPHHGPVREIDVDNNVAITLRWAGNDMTTDGNYLTELSMAASVDEARAALENITAVGANQVVADTEGNIGWFPYARVPRRTWATNLDGAAPPWLPLDGAGDYEWTEYFSYSELPQLLNPEQGFVATANNDMTGALADGDPTTLPSGATHPPYQADVSPGYRHARIVNVIEEGGATHDRDTMHRIQHDSYSSLGRDMVPEIVKIAEDEQTDLSPEAESVLRALKAWNLSCPTGVDGPYSDPGSSPLTSDLVELQEASGCAAFHATLLKLCELIHEDDGDLVASTGSDCPSFAAFYSIVDPSQLAAGDIYWDDAETPEVEDKHQVMATALANVYDLLANERGLGADETKWAWGRLHGLTLRSNLDTFLQPSYNNPPRGQSRFANIGGHEIIASAYAEEDLGQEFGVVYRIVCEVPQSGPICTVQLAGGQSAHIDSEHYEDLLFKYLEGEPIDLVFDIDVAKANAVRTVTFD